MYMDYLEGETLADRITSGPMPAKDVVKLGCDLLDALEAAHGTGTTHRDVKPGNVVLVGGRADRGRLEAFIHTCRGGFARRSGALDPGHRGLNSTPGTRLATRRSLL